MQIDSALPPDVTYRMDSLGTKYTFLVQFEPLKRKKASRLRTRNSCMVPKCVLEVPL